MNNNNAEVDRINSNPESYFQNEGKGVFAIALNKKFGLELMVYEEKSGNEIVNLHPYAIHPDGSLIDSKGKIAKTSISKSGELTKISAGSYLNQLLEEDHQDSANPERVSLASKFIESNLEKYGVDKLEVPVQVPLHRQPVFSLIG